MVFYQKQPKSETKIIVNFIILIHNKDFDIYDFLLNGTYIIYMYYEPLF